MVQAGVLRKVTIGDEELDSRFRFSADEVADLRVFEHRGATEAIRVLAADAGLRSLSVRHDRVDAKWAPRRPQLDEDPGVLRTRLEAVSALVTACGYPPAVS
jgi:hypothetical protein